MNAIVEAENQRGLKHKDFNEETCAPLPNMFGYFLSYDTLAGMDRFTSRRAKQGDSWATP